MGEFLKASKGEPLLEVKASAIKVKARVFNEIPHFLPRYLVAGAFKVKASAFKSKGARLQSLGGV